MLDLNVDAATDDDDHRKTPTADSLTSTTTDNTAIDELDSSTSTVLPLISFSILNQIEQDGVVNELQLFPATDASSPPHVAVTAKYWLNLSVPEESGVKLGIYNGANNPVVQQVKKTRRGPRSRSSQYRGVTFYRRTGRWESHIWDCGKQVYLGGFDTAHSAARAYDRAAIKFRGVDADINFNFGDYEEEMKQTMNLTKAEFVQILRRQKNGSSRGSSKYREVTLNECGQWEGRMGPFVGKRAYDQGVIKSNVTEAIPSIDLRNYDTEININSGNGGSDGSLDLNLNISLGPEGLQENYTARNLHSYFPGSPDWKRVKTGIPSASPHGLVRATASAPMWPGIYSGLAPSNKEMASGINSEVVPLEKERHGVVISTPLLPSAASSRFCCVTTPYSRMTSKSQFSATAFSSIH